METEKRKAEEHTESGNGRRHEKDEQEVERTGKDYLGQGWMDSAGGRPMRN